MEASFFSSKINRTLGAIALVMLIVALASYAILNFRSAQITKDTPPSITVSGEGETKVTPNVAELSFSVRTNDTSAEVAQASTTARINEIITMLKNNGVEEKDIKTVSFDLYEHYPDWSAPVCEVSVVESDFFAADSYGFPTTEVCAPTEYKPDGFESVQTIAILIRDLAKAGMIASEVTKKGATNISNLSFTTDDKTSGKQIAREQAIADARTRADMIALQFGKKVKRMTSYYENEYSGSNPFSPSSYDAEYAVKSASGEPMLPAGEQTIKASVSVTFELE
jgi:uncharacterized protein